MTLSVAVAGCGPAGLATALLLARDGHRVVVFDRFAEPRPVGSGLMLQPTGLAVLRELGLDREILAQGARVERLFGRAEPSGRVVLDVRYGALRRPGLFGLGIHRAALFGTLFSAARRAGIPIETGRAVAAAPPGSGGRRHVAFAGDRTAGPFDLVVDALGTGTPLLPPTGRALAYGALWASLPTPAGAAGAAGSAMLEQRYVRASVMAGLLPLGRPSGFDGDQTAFFWSIRLDRHDAWREAGLAPWIDAVRRLWPATAPFLERIETPEQLTLARYTHRTAASPAEAGLIHLGDAWRSASPQLGQGANMALLDAYALALALRGAPDVAVALARAVGLRRRHVALYQAMSALFTPVYQSDGRALPFLRDRVVGPLARVPPAPRVLAAMVSGLVGAPLRPLGLEPYAEPTLPTA